MIKKTFKKITDTLLLQGQSVSYVAYSLSLGVFIACTPFIGLHTAMIFALSFLMSANVVVVFATVYLVSNPITMIPLLALEYFFGEWLFQSVFGVDLLKYNPSFMVWFNNKVGHYVTSYMGIEELSFWSLILGGTLFAVIAALLAYPCAKTLFRHIANKKKSDENNSTK